MADLTYTLEWFLSQLAQTGVSRRTVAQFEGAYLLMMAFEPDGMRGLVQTAAQWQDNYEAWIEMMESFRIKVEGV